MQVRSKVADELDLDLKVLQVLQRRSGEDCVSQEKCPGFLDLKDQLNSAAKGTDQYSRLLSRSILKSG